ncbi:hypothetical protein M5X17_31335 [Paenibacillus alvei]|uniref:hypothetical protein n=1 Tax=Paenibacillus alvei TaxID=44250 RepID=UPI0022819D59|nr:hypothetical protein [Paenibacillus alvei]MCY9738188.1 hypothetical protein [Paenibacillus alvei]
MIRKIEVETKVVHEEEFKNGITQSLSKEMLGKLSQLGLGQGKEMEQKQTETEGNSTLSEQKEPVLVLSDHAKEQLKERFDCDTYIKQNILVRKFYENSIELCETVSEKGTRALMLVANYGLGTNAAVYIKKSEENKILVVTVMKFRTTDHHIPDDIYSDIMNIYFTKLNKLVKQETHILNHMEYYETEANAIIWTSKFSILKTSSEKKKEQLYKEIETAEQNLQKIKNELSELQCSIRHVARSLATQINVNKHRNNNL